MSCFRGFAITYIIYYFLIPPDIIPLQYSGVQLKLHQARIRGRMNYLLEDILLYIAFSFEMEINGLNLEL